MFWIYGSFEIVTVILCQSFLMLYHVWLWSCHPCNLSLLFYSLSLTIQFETKIVKWSIITLSRLSRVIRHLASHQFVINQVYQTRRNIWQYINYNFTESRISKHGEIWFSVVQFRLVHSSIQVPTWLWYNHWRGLKFPKGIRINFSDIVALVGQEVARMYTPVFKAESKHWEPNLIKLRFSWFSKVIIDIL